MAQRKKFPENMRRAKPQMGVRVLEMVEFCLRLSS